jgi:sulfate transport system ATP-binding protein
MEVADEIVVMNKGRIEQIGSPAQIYDHPATPFVMSFIGNVNILDANSCLLESHGNPQTDSKIFVRPHNLIIEKEENSFNSTVAVVKRLIHLGWEVQVELILKNGETFKAVVTRDQFKQLNLEVNQRVYVRPNDVRFFAPDYMI